MYERALKLSPMAVLVRSKLIDLLGSHGDIDKALEHYMILGDTFYQMAQLDQAREKYNEALRLAPRGNPGRKWGVRILHRIGDIDMQRVDWRQAISVYERIRDLAPQDEKARMMLMDLYNRLQEPARALAELDGLLSSYRQSGKEQKISAVLEQVIQERPEDMLLRTRLIQVYLEQKNVEGALEQLDALGEMQIQAGRTQEAIRTIQTILQLNPPNTEAYQELLQQLTSGQTA
jgi:tetratricopeptide (TPR) repeat protein